jgi:hypothetical protein
VAEHDEPRPPLGDEATRLIGAVQEWARQTFPAGRDGHGGPECEWCPLCQFMAVVRGERPEVTERVAEAGTAVASAFRALMEAASSGAPGKTDTPRVQRIDLDLGDPETPA